MIWGNILTTTGTLASTLVQDNSLRYRGYVFDTESELYYLQSRYYDPEVGRFLNFDDPAYLGTDGILSYNSFAYCGNNPVRRTDPDGKGWLEDVWEWVCDAAEEVAEFFGDLFGAEYSSSVTVSESEIQIIPDPAPVTATQGQYVEQQIVQNGDSSKFLSVYANVDAKDPLLSSTVGGKINVACVTADLSLGYQDTSLSLYASHDNNTAGVSIKLDLSKLKVGFEFTNSSTRENMTHTTYYNISVSGWAVVAAAIILMGAPAYMPCG